MRKLRPFPDLLLALVSLGASFLCLELFARFYVDAWPFDRDERADLSYLTDKDETLLWRPEPNQQGRNSLGLRNREIGLKKEAQYRILFLGDSLVWWGDTSSGQPYTHEIEARLNDSSHSVEYEVINAGVPGYTTYQELEFLKIYGLEMDPDLVVLGFVLNDVFYKYLHKPQKGQLLGNEPSSNLNRFSKESGLGRVFANSYAAHGLVYLQDLVAQRLSRAPRFPFDQRSDLYLAWQRHGWAKTDMLFAEMSRLLGARGIRLVVIAFPIVDQLNDDYRRLDREYVLFPQRQLQAICRRHGIAVVDLMEALYRHGGPSLYKDYLHLNEPGNDVVADEVTAYLLSLLRGSETDLCQ